MTMYRCAWPGCTATTEQWFADGWANYTIDPKRDADAMGCDEELPSLPNAGLLCPSHKLAYEDLACGVTSPTKSER
jgi:hypothetical protein